MNKIIKGLIIIAALNLITCALPFSKPPRLIVLLVVDQMRPDLKATRGICGSVG